MNSLEEIGIKYKKNKIGDNLYLLVPEELISGYSVSPVFYSIAEHKMPQSREIIEENEELVDNIYSIKDLCDIYEFDDQEFVKSYFFEEEKDKAIVIDTSGKEIRKIFINLDTFRCTNIEETYRLAESEPSVVLNDNALTHLLNLENIDTIRRELQRYKKTVKTFAQKNEEDSLTKVCVQNGHVTEVNIDKNIIGVGIDQDDYDPKMDKVNINLGAPVDPKTISVTSLENYIKERVFGHPDEIRQIATILIMNLRATKEDGVESILIPGPTGTGKTATIEAASEFLGIPFKIVDTSNLVAQGIKGTSIEDELYSLFSLADNKRELAEKGIIAFDEFDKLSQSDLDIKGPIKNILLKFIEGTTYRIERLKGDIYIDTKLLSKLFLGAFEELFAEEKSIGFGQGPSQNSRREFDINRMYEKNIYSKELISRIPHVIPYYELTDEIKRDIILKSKLSKYLMKKKRYEREFNVELMAEDSYIEALIAALNEKDRSIRDLNNLILKSLADAEHELLLQEGHVKKLVLTSDTVADSKKFKLL